MFSNYYLLLGVPEDADAGTIRRAFRALARRYHPDAGEGSSADRFREVLTAYETLTDPRRRGQYDHLLHSRRIPMRSVVEPTRAHDAPEPMLSRQPEPMCGPRPLVRVNQATRPLWVMRFDELFDQLLQSWDEVIVRGPFERRTSWP
jgi:curved DNA-binding protein CbpA